MKLTPTPPMYILLKLSSGEEVIGTIDEGEFMNLESKPYEINVEDAYSVMYASNGSGGYGIKLSPFMPCSQEKLFTFYMKHVILYSVPEKSVVEFYESMKSHFEEKDGEDQQFLTEEFPKGYSSLH